MQKSLALHGLACWTLGISGDPSASTGGLTSSTRALAMPPLPVVLQAWTRSYFLQVLTWGV